jgi:hypothetical protein
MILNRFYLSNKKEFHDPEPILSGISNPKFVYEFQATDKKLPLPYAIMNRGRQMAWAPFKNRLELCFRQIIFSYKI